MGECVTRLGTPAADGRGALWDEEPLVAMAVLVMKRRTARRVVVNDSRSGSMSAAIAALGVTRAGTCSSR
jgi:hypothetical protein